MERITENVCQRLLEAVEGCDRALDGGDAHDLMDAVDFARGSMTAARELILSLPAGSMDYIKWLEAELDKRVPRWISVEERLPEDDSHYLVWAHDNGAEEVALYYGDGEWLTDDLENITRVVTHWMPLPEPPEEGDDEG